MLGVLVRAIRRWPSASELDTFLFARGGVPWRQAKNPAGEGWKLYQNVADHLVKGEKLIITGEWARRPIHILDLAQAHILALQPGKCGFFNLGNGDGYSVREVIQMSLEVMFSVVEPEVSAKIASLPLEAKQRLQAALANLH